MYRRLRSVVVPALLILLTASAAQARPLHVQAPPASLWAQVWQGWSAAWSGGWIKEGPGMDPNGSTPHQPMLRSPVRGDHPDQVRVRR